MKIAVVGATGLVGQTMLRVLEEHHIQIEKLIPVASANSIGKTLLFNGLQHKIVSVEDAISMQPDIALFSAGGEASLKYAPLFSAAGITVIDNSSAWRKDINVPLVVPEVNAQAIKRTDRIIANPNCSTIQLVAAIAPLHRKYGIKRLVLSTYQSVSGSGVKGIRQLEGEEKGSRIDIPAYPHQIYRNLIPHGGDFNADGYTTEEQKLVFETRKILSAPEIAITATVVRVPVDGGHSIAANIEFENDYNINDLRKILETTQGLIVQDNPAENFYPMPLFAHNKDAVFIGRIRRDESIKNGLNLWIVADNLRKGAATNAVQIASWLINNHHLD